MLSIFDVILLILLSGFVFYGLFVGFIRAIGAFFGTFIGIWLAGKYYLAVYSAIGGVFGSFENFGKIICFLLVISIATKLISLLFGLLDKMFNIISIIPFLTTFNKLLGGILGLLVGCLMLSTSLYVISRYAIITNLFGRWLVESQIAPWFIKLANLISPLLPEMLRALQSVV